MYGADRREKPANKISDQWLKKRATLRREGDREDRPHAL